MDGWGAAADQLDSQEPISTLASMLVPPGYSIDHQTLVDLFDVDLVKANLAALGDMDTWHLDPWAAGPAKRIKAVLEERDSDDPNDDQNFGGGVEYRLMGG